LSVYGGPDFGSDEEAFSIPDPITELGFLVAWVDARGSTARGVAFKQAMYHRFGGPEIDDMAAAVRSLAQRPYVDGNRVGIYGISYGGYAALMALERYPEVFKAGSASSPVTDWHGYDSIYTERYMGLPSVQAEAYDRAAVLGKVAQIKARLQIYYGTADDNVHPSHSLMLIRELDQIGKGYDLAVGPDRGHDGVNEARMMEFFIGALGQPK
jgi:dipeptidyl-peptidase-4